MRPAPEAGAAAPGGDGLWRFALLSAAYFGFLGYFNPYLPLWLKSLGFSTLVIGVLLATQSATRVVAPYAWAWLADVTGHRVALMRVASALATLCACTLLLVPQWVSPSVGYLGVALFAMFANTAAMMPMTEAALSRRVSLRGRFDVARYGRVRVWGSVGFLLTVFAAGFGFERLGIERFPASAVLLLAVLVIACWCLPGGRDYTRHPDAAPTLWPVLRQPVVAWFFASMFFMVLAHIGLYGFYSLYLDALGYDKRAVGALWALSVAAEIVWLLWQGRWFGRASLHGWLIAAGAIAVLRFGLIAAFGASLAMLVLAQSLHAVTFAAHHTVCISLITAHFPDRLRARGQALYSVIGYGGPGLVGSLGGGWLSERLGLGAVFWAAAFVAALSTACAVVARRFAVLGARATETATATAPVPS